MVGFFVFDGGDNGRNSDGKVVPVAIDGNCYSADIFVAVYIYIKLNKKGIKNTKKKRFLVVNSVRLVIPGLCLLYLAEKVESLKYFVDFKEY